VLLFPEVQYIYSTVWIVQVIPRGRGGGGGGGEGEATEEEHGGCGSTGLGRGGGVGGETHLYLEMNSPTPRRWDSLHCFTSHREKKEFSPRTFFIPPGDVFFSTVDG